MAIEVKIDKETLIKHRFWFLLPAIAIAILVGWICVLGVRAEAEDNQKKANSVQQQLKGIMVDGELRNDEWVRREALKKAESQTMKAEVWAENADFQNGVKREQNPNAAPPAPGLPKPLGKVLEIQSPLIAWPEETIREWDKNNRERVSVGGSLGRRDFGENLGIIPNDYKDHFRMQLDRMLDILPWLDESKQEGYAGAVRMLDGAGLNHRERALLLFNIADLKSNNRDVLSQEAWTLLEELAIRRELMKSLSGVIDSYSLMQEEWRRIPPAPAAPAAPAAPGAAPAAPKPEAKGAALEGGSGSFYNFVWPTLTPVAAPAPAAADAPKVPMGTPTIESWQGWQVDLELVQRDNKKLFLRGTAANYCATQKVPPAKIVVWFISGETNAEMAKTVTLEDAGDLPAAQPTADGKLTVPALKKQLKEVDAPSGAVKISRITRAPQGAWIDAAAVFNQNWLVDVKLANQPGSAVTQAVCTVWNRGARRLPVPYFKLE
jgi:hypothetical protein